jgi:hypothetical protein
VKSISTEDIIAIEERLRLAMLNSNTVELQALLSDELLFTSHQGAIVHKRDDIAFHKARTVVFHKIEYIDQKIKICNGFALTSTLVHLEGTAGTAAIKSNMRYSRIWAISDSGILQLIAGHSSECVKC